MGQWYCYVGSQQCGPVSEDVLRSWVEQGRVGRSDRVWTEGMADWVQAGTVAWLFEGPPSAPQPAGASPTVPPPGGTGGQTPNRQLTSQARDILRGRWGLPIGFCVLYMLIFLAISIVPYASNIVVLIITGPLQLGMVIFFLTFTRRGQGRIGMLFAGFRNFGKALAAYLLVLLFVALWWVVPVCAGAVVGLVAGWVIGGIAGNVEAGARAGVIAGLIAGYIPGLILAMIAQLSYYQTFYLLADGPSLGPLEAIRKSRKMMYGHRTKLFYLGLRYFAWSLLCMLTCGIGFLWLAPYASVWFARFYDDLLPPSQAAIAAQAVTGEPASPPSPHEGPGPGAPA